jgi:hypothetical protein
MLKTPAPSRHKILAREARPGDVLVELIWGNLGRKPLRRTIWAVKDAPDPEEIALSVTSDTADKDTLETATTKYYKRDEWLLVERGGES